MSVLRPAYARVLRRALARRGWTQVELARRARVSTRTVQRALRGQTCDLDTVEALARAMRVSLITEAYHDQQEQGRQACE